jgi:hypothetical protein
MLQVENKPLCDYVLGARWNKKYPTESLDVGQSFFCPDAGKYNSINVTCRAYQRAHPGVRFSIRREDGGVRAYRVA